MIRKAEIAGYEISIVIEQERDGIYAVAYCPVCGHKDESHDHGYGADHAATVTTGKIRMHMMREHQAS